MTARETVPVDPTPPSVDSAPPTPAGRRSWFLLGLVVVMLVGTTTAMFLPLVPEAYGVSAILMMLTLIFLRVPVALAMIIPALAGLYALRGAPLIESTFATLPYGEVASWSLSVVPMFILMGLLLWRAGLTDSLYGAARSWLGWMPGGLAVGTNVAGAGLAAVSGSTVGTTYALARMGIPEMLKAGYDKRLAIGSVIVAGLPGQLIPPSLLLVIYAGIAEVPVGPQLLAGVGPGVFVAVLFSITLVIFARWWAPATSGAPATAATAGTGGSPAPAPGPAPVVTSATWAERFSSLAPVWPVPLLIAVIIWGMFSGVFTATEAGSVAALVCVVLTLFWKRGQQPMRAVAEAATATASSVGAIFFMLVGVEALSRMFALTGISNGFAQVIGSLELGRIEFLLLMMVVYLLLGTFMEPISMMLLTIPILMPTLVELDISLLWYGVFAVFMAELAVVTPPVGILSFIIHSILKEPEVNQGQHLTLGDVFRACGWFLPAAVLVAIVLIFFPEIATWLPDQAAG